MANTKKPGRGNTGRMIRDLIAPRNVQVAPGAAAEPIPIPIREDLAPEPIVQASTLTLEDLGRQVATDGRRRFIITMHEDIERGIDWERTVWVYMPIQMALSLLIDAMPNMRAMEQAEAFGLTPKQVNEAVQSPMGQEGI